MQPTTNSCKNCGNTFTGKFCNVCGEKVYGPHDKKIRHLAEEVFHFITHFEGSFFTTVKTFLTRPGKFSVDYCNGIRKKYFRPISLFLLLVVIYLLFPKFQSLNMRFDNYVSEESPYGWYAVPPVRKKVNTYAITEKELGKRYDKKSSTFAKICLLLLIPLSAFALSILFVLSKRYFFDHFILAIEITSFYIFFIFLVAPLLVSIISGIAPATSSVLKEGAWAGNIFLIIFMIFLGIFITIALRNFYKQKWWITILKAAVFLFLLTMVIPDVYKFILYHLIMFSI